LVYINSDPNKPERMVAFLFGCDLLIAMLNTIDVCTQFR